MPFFLPELINFKRVHAFCLFFNRIKFADIFEGDLCASGLGLDLDALGPGVDHLDEIASGVGEAAQQPDICII